MCWSVLIVSLYLFLLLKLILLRILSSLFLSLSLSFFSILFILITVDGLQIWSKLCFYFDSVYARALLVVRWTDTPADGCFWTLLLLLFYCCVFCQCSSIGVVVVVGLFLNCLFFFVAFWSSRLIISFKEIKFSVGLIFHINADTVLLRF